MAATAHATDETIRVLFIEDDPAVAEMYKLKLELDGYQVRVVTNDDRVLQEAARLLPVIILSSSGPHEMEGRGFKADHLDYVVRADPAPGGLSWKVEDWAAVQPS